ncbi:MAG: protein jag [Firmicutes bacterium]|nr:protein jag [Bacillota bacterium]
MKKRQNRMPQRKVSEELVLDSIERWGNDVETAVSLALEALKVGRDEVDVEVLEEPSKGFFGIGAKLARVKVSKKVKEEAPQEQEQLVKKPQRGPIRKEEVTEEEKNSYSNIAKDNKRDSKEGRGGKGRGNKKKEEKKNYDEILPEEPIMPVVDIESLQPLEDHEGLSFLKNVAKEMGLDISITGKTDGKDLFFFIEGKDSGTIIGKRGATLDAIQYLTSLVVNKEGKDYIRVVVDAENYRAKREKSLEKLALRLADKVARSKRSYKLEPMNPYERKVIHATLQKDNRIVTRSEGQDPSRRVIIEPK